MTADARDPDRGGGMLLLVSIFVLAICGLVYELVAGTLSSYLLGDPVSHFSLAIGLFLTAMGIGSWFSRFVQKDLMDVFVGVELAVGVIGGVTALVGFVLFTYTDLYLPGLFVLILTIGGLIGMEIPLIVRILREQNTLRITMANVMSVDYVGALVAAIGFPFFLLPQLGLVRAGLAMGLANVCVAGLIIWRLGHRMRAPRRLGTMTAASAVLLTAGFVTADGMVSHLENRLYQDEIVLAKTTAHQRVVVTRWREDIRLFLDGHLQFSSLDEYRYHEALVHPAMSLSEKREEVLILGGGDGLAVKQVLAYPDVKRVTLVDLDAGVTDLFREHALLRRLNDDALRDPRVVVHNEDALHFLDRTSRLFDVVIMDLPDPNGPALAKLYSKPCFRLVRRRLARGGMLATQATSPYRARRAFWCIVHTLEAAGFEVAPLHAYIPTFGTWGFALASRERPKPDKIRVTVPTRFLTDAVAKSLFVLPPDLGEIETPVNELNDPVVSRLYRDGYNEYFD